MKIFSMNNCTVTLLPLTEHRYPRAEGLRDRKATDYGYGALPMLFGFRNVTVSGRGSGIQHRVTA